MSILAALQALSATGAFASRAFLPLLLVGTIARWPQLVNWLPLVPEHPIVLSARLEWLSSPWCLAGLAALTLLEAWAERSPEARQILQEIDAPLKGAVAFVTAFALVDPESADVLRHVAEFPVVTAGPQAGSFPTLLALAFALGVGALTAALAWWRVLVLREARDIADDLGLSGPVAWLEDAWSASSLLLAALAPVAALVVALVGLGVLAVAQRALERAADARRRPCPSCGAGCLPAAVACASCGRDVEPCSTGAGAGWPDRWLSGRNGRASELLGRGRCPDCAERREASEILALSPHACGWPARRSDGSGWAPRLLADVRGRTVPLAVVAGALGLLPVAGSAAALVLARARLAAPLRRYVPLGIRLRTRWMARLLAVPLLLGSGVPIVSAACAMGLVAMSSLLWCRAFRSTTCGPVTAPARQDPRGGGSAARSST